MATRDRERGRVRTQRRERVRRDEQQVVSGKRARSEPLERRRRDAQAKQVFRQREAAARGPEKRRVPPARRQRNDVRVPPEDPRIERRIERVVRKHRSDVLPKRPCVRDREGGVPGGGGEPRPSRPDVRHECDSNPVQLSRTSAVRVDGTVTICRVFTSCERYE